MDIRESIWIEKYRPTKFPEIHGQEKIVERIEAMVKLKNIPHLLFTGPPGVGKSTLALVIAKELFGDSWQQNFLELNTSDDRGIDTIRGIIKDFARIKPIGDFPFKIIFLDECLDYNTIVEIKKDNIIQNIKLGELVINHPNNVQIASTLDNGEKTFVNINRFINLEHNINHGFYEITYHNKKIKATGNHLILTEEGWKKVNQLKKGDLIVGELPIKSNNDITIKDNHIVINFELVCLPIEIIKKERYAEVAPEKKIIEVLAQNGNKLSYKEIANLTNISKSKISSILREKKDKRYISLPSLGLVKRDDLTFSLIETKGKAIEMFKDAKRKENKKNEDYIKNQLKILDLYPLKKEKAIILARICGHIFGDGSLVLKNRSAFFSGQLEDMQTIKKEIEYLGFKPYEIKYGKWKNGECWSFTCCSIVFVSLLYSLGCPAGKKTDNYFLMPEWIIKGDKDIKREFAKGFFGAEGYKPMFQKEIQNINFKDNRSKPIYIAQNKREDLIENLNDYLEQWKILLEEFGLSVRKKINNKRDNLRKDGTYSVKGKIWITNSRKNIIKFLKEIGYVYCKYKEDLQKEALAYLQWRETLGKGNYTFKPIIGFEEWLKDFYLKDCSFYYIQEIKKITDPERVYCLTTENSRFIADGVVVHNCDNMTKDAQHALRRTMETFAQSTRFLLSCNYSSKIIDPLLSRCTVFRFKPLEEKEIKKIIENIALKENLNINEEAVKALYKISEGDCRKLENVLQSCAAIDNNINEELVFSLVSAARPKEIKDIMEIAIKGDFLKSREKLLDTMLKYGLSGIDTIKQMQKEIWSLEIEEQKKVSLIDKCGEIEFRIVEGSDEFVQIESFLANLVLVNIKI